MKGAANVSDSNQPSNPFECMPIFKEFKPETLQAMLAAPWTAEGGSRTKVKVDLGPHGEQEAAVCPIAYCLIKEGKAWLVSGDGYIQFESSPTDSKIARQLMGIGKYDEIPSERIDEYNRLRQEAVAFYNPWDMRNTEIDLAKAACIEEPALAGATS